MLCCKFLYDQQSISIMLKDATTFASFNTAKSFEGIQFSLEATYVS